MGLSKHKSSGMVTKVELENNILKSELNRGTCTALVSYSNLHVLDASVFMSALLSDLGVIARP
jgi:hypothetical protein